MGKFLQAVDYRTKFVQLLDLDNGSYSGTVNFDYSDYGSQTWYIRWDFMPYATDMTGSDQTIVPEPATLFLVGFGLLGIAGLRRKF